MKESDLNYDLNKLNIIKSRGLVLVKNVFKKSCEIIKKVRKSSSF